MKNNEVATIDNYLSLGFLESLFAIDIGSHLKNEKEYGN